MKLAIWLLSIATVGQLCALVIISHRIDIHQADHDAKIKALYDIVDAQSVRITSIAGRFFYCGSTDGGPLECSIHE